MTDKIEPHISQLFEIGNRLGKGAYGVVWKVKNRLTGKYLALKKIYNAFQNSTDAQRTYREIMYLKKIRQNENIIKLYDVIASENGKDIYISFELMESDLHLVTRANLLNKDQIRYILYQLGRALKFLHSAKLIHRDLKPSNIFINSDCKIKIGDFGLVRALKSERRVLSENIATKSYKAPELILSSHSYTEAIDIWAFGCVMAELLLKKTLFKGNGVFGQLQSICDVIGLPNKTDIKALKAEKFEGIFEQMAINKEGCFWDLFKGLEPSAVELMQSIFRFNPKNRPKIDDILSHSYFKEVRDIKYEKTYEGNLSIPIDDNQRLPVEVYKNALFKLSKYTSTKKENTSTNNFFLPDILKKSENNTRNPFKRKTKANLSEINKFLHDHKKKIGNDNNQLSRQKTFQKHLSLNKKQSKFKRKESSIGSYNSKFILARKKSSMDSMKCFNSNNNNRKFGKNITFSRQVNQSQKRLKEYLSVKNRNNQSLSKIMNKFYMYN